MSSRITITMRKDTTENTRSKVFSDLEIRDVFMWRDGPDLHVKLTRNKYRRLTGSPEMSIQPDVTMSQDSNTYNAPVILVDLELKVSNLRDREVITK